MTNKNPSTEESTIMSVSSNGVEISASEETHEIPDEDVFQLLMLYFSSLFNQAKIRGNQLLTQHGLYDILDKVAQQSAKHPYLATALSIGAVIFGIPVLIIAIFTLSTIAITFTGLIFIEVDLKGTLISIASVLLFGCLGAALIVFMFFGFLALASYFGFLHIYDLLSSLHNKSALRNYVRRESAKNR